MKQTLLVAQTLAELQALDPDALVAAFTNRTRDDDFETVGSAIVSRNAPAHWRVFAGYDYVKGNDYSAK